MGALPVCAGQPDPVRILASSPLRFEPSADRPGAFVSAGLRYRFEFESNRAVLRTGESRAGFRFEGATRGTRLEGSARLRSTTNEFLGNDKSRWRRSVANYGRLEARDLYPGIDLVYYGQAGELEYDVVVKPGADPRKVRLRFDGVAPRIDAEGNLSAGFLSRRPVAWQLEPDGTRKPVSAGYRRNRDGTFGIALGSWDRRRELVFDPTLTLSYYVGGSSGQRALAVGHDASGFFYVAGETLSTDVTMIGDSIKSMLAGARDIFIAKIDPNAPAGNQVVYSTYLGGALDETFGGMVVSRFGFLYLTGSTKSTDFPLVNAVQPSLNGTSDAWVAWIDPAEGSGGLLFSTYLGGGADETARGIAVDALGRVFITGGSTSSDFPQIGAYQPISAGSSDAYLAGIDPASSTLFYSSYIGGSNWDEGYGVAVAPDGTVWIAGATFSFDFPIIAQSFQAGYGGDGDAFVAHFNPNVADKASILYTSYLGGSDIDAAKKILVDASGRLVVTGYTSSADFVVSRDAAQPLYAGGTDIFVSLLDPTRDRGAQLVYSTLVGGSLADVPFDMVADGAGNYYLTGFTASPDFPVTPNALSNKVSGGNSVFVLKVNPSRPGTAGIDFASHIASPGTQVGYGIDVDSTGTLYVAGSTSGGLFDSLGGVARATSTGNTDGFLLGLSLCSFDLPYRSEAFPSGGGSDTILLTVSGSCGWKSWVPVDWVTLAPGSGVGTASVLISVAPNTTGAPRNVTISIGPLSFQVSQN